MIGAGFAVMLLGIVILILIPFIYFGLKMAGFPKLAIGICTLLFFIILIPFLKISYRSEMYSKEDAFKDFQDAQIQIKNISKIEANDISGYKAVTQEATFIGDSVEINQLINRMEKRPDFLISPNLLNFRDEFKRKNVGKVIRFYRHKDQYIIETFQNMDQYTIKSAIFTFKKNNDTIKLSKLEDS